LEQLRLRGDLRFRVAPDSAVSIMNYLKLHRSRIVLVCFLTASLLLWALPSIDLEISSWLFDRAPSVEKRLWIAWFHEGIGYFLVASLVGVVGLYLYNRSTKRNLCGVDGRKVLFLFLVLIIGLGLIVNVLLKDQFGRARPRDIEEFGGSKRFTPAFVLSRECDTNCSFSSGEGAAAFFSLSLAMALTRRRFAYLAAFAFTGLASYFRVSAGAHFFSDVVVSFFVMFLVTDVLYYYLIAPGAQPVWTSAIPSTAT
jgi:lipid A 4'-phosphatase